MLELDLHADTREGLADALRELAAEVESGKNPDGFSAGSSGGGTFKLTENPDQTPERYQEQLRAYLEQMKEESRDV